MALDTVVVADVAAHEAVGVVVAVEEVVTSSAGLLTCEF